MHWSESLGSFGVYRQGRFGALLNFKNEQPLFDHENVFSVVVLLVGQPASHHCGAWAIYNSHSGQGIPFAYDTGLTTHILCTPVLMKQYCQNVSFRSFQWGSLEGKTLDARSF